MLNPAGILLFIILVVIPAYYLNRWLVNITRPRESLKNVFLYFLLSVLFALVYSAVFIFVLFSIYPVPKK